MIGYSSRLDVVHRVYQGLSPATLRRVIVRLAPQCDASKIDDDRLLGWVAYLSVYRHMAIVVETLYPK